MRLPCHDELYNDKQISRRSRRGLYLSLDWSPFYDRDDGGETAMREITPPPLFVAIGSNMK